MSITNELADLAEQLAAYRYRSLHELGVQAGIAEVLRTAGIDFTTEEKLDTKSRIDFLAGVIGIEVKVDGTWPDVQRQLIRYAKHDRVQGLLLATTRHKHTMPETLEGKPLRVVILRGGLL